MKHYLIGEIETIATFDAYDKEAIKNAIIQYLQSNPNDMVTHSKDCDLSGDKLTYCGYQPINFYEVNPKNGQPSLIIIKGCKTFYKSLV